MLLIARAEETLATAQAEEMLLPVRAEGTLATAPPRAEATALDPGIFPVGPIEGAMRSEEAGVDLMDPELALIAIAALRAWDLAEDLEAGVAEEGSEEEVAEAEEEEGVVAEAAGDGADKQP
jgi:hypothetical protein